MGGKTPPGRSLISGEIFGEEATKHGLDAALAMLLRHFFSPDKRLACSRMAMSKHLSRW
jgi:hypothetical protein